MELQPAQRLGLELKSQEGRTGHCIRIAIGGADTHIVMSYSNGGPERFGIFRGAEGSTATLPLRPSAQDLPGDLP